ncbi:Cell wall integrity and stress response component 4 [Neurospora sp. IMI 360204]|nr:Cell wall integrity and stress response component 4 [Neurospora sp. IMI 360204]
MARQRAARLWACLALVASLCGNALAVGPSHDVAYCATVNTADMDSNPTQPTTQTVTVGGEVRTVVVTPTPTATIGGQLAEPEPNGKKKAISTGAAVGIAIGVVAALGIIGVLLWIWYMRRRKQNEESGSSFSSPRGSSAGMKGATVTETRFAPDLVAWGDGPGSKRRSTLMPVDPRLNPYGNALFNGRNKSRESITSFQDNQDYSRRVVGQPRVLRAVNPDPINED